MKTLSIIELSEKFPTEASAIQWFEKVKWPGEDRDCPHCGSIDTYEGKHPKAPYRCRDCWKYFGVKTGTVMANSRLPCRKWLFALYLDSIHPKGISSIRLAEMIGVTQKTTWFMQQRIREAFGNVKLPRFDGPVEVDETFVGGIERRKHQNKRLFKNWRKGKTVVIGMRDRVTGKVKAVVAPDEATKDIIKRFIYRNIKPGSSVYTDEGKGYKMIANRQSVGHGYGEYVRGDVHTNGIESFWGILKRAYKGTFHYISPQHLHRYVNELCWRHNHRMLDPLSRMRELAKGMIGISLTYKELIRKQGVLGYLDS